MTTSQKPEVPAEVRAMLANMGLRHPLDCTPAERAENTARQHDKATRLFDRVGDTRNAASARRAAASARRAARIARAQ
jgi:hypothetical protein